jgi:hypothetical protein
MKEVCVDSFHSVTFSGEMTMRNRLSKIGLVVTCIAILGLASHVLAGPTVPYKESTDGQLTSSVNPTITNPLGSQTWVAVGQATHMGKYSESGGHNFTAPNAQGQGLILNGKFTSVAADGSTISGVYSGTYTVLPNNMVQYTVTATWLTGTGRLTGVTGTGGVVALLNGATGKFHFETNATWTLP